MAEEQATLSTDEMKELEEKILEKAKELAEKEFVVASLRT